MLILRQQTTSNRRGRVEIERGKKEIQRTFNGRNRLQIIGVAGVAVDELQRHGALGGWRPGDGEWTSSSNTGEGSVGEGVWLGASRLGCGHDGEGAGQESGDEAHGDLGLLLWFWFGDERAERVVLCANALTVGATVRRSMYYKE